ncbi:MAG: diacylglycerol kinase [Nitrospirae bacterium]|nr:diacylglycerol kinase [Nitrospirota bacterium]MBF0591074.1 diacylglycerol kinase [Nitrospirota bacterium]
MPLRRSIDSANNAIEGILIAAKTERHLRYHLYVAALVILFSYIAGVTKTEFLIISIVTLVVIMAELINTAIEATVNILSPEKHEKARIAKDVAAGAVLTTAIGAAVIGYIILLPYLVNIFEKGFHVSHHGGNEIAVLSLIIVIILVVLLKAFTGKGHPLRGGMPSGHAALSFSIWMSITLITKNLIVSLLSLLVAVLIAQSRLTIQVHNLWEVFLGAATGSIVTFLLFWIFA